MAILGIVRWNIAIDRWMSKHAWSPQCVEACVSGALKLVNGEILAQMKRKNSYRLFIRD